jgi:hypothetical protein
MSIKIEDIKPGDRFVGQHGIYEWTALREAAMDLDVPYLFALEMISSQGNRAIHLVDAEYFGALIHVPFDGKVQTYAAPYLPRLSMHEYKEVQLFTSTSIVCIKCGRGQEEGGLSCSVI